jgi:hypothetical protein
LVPFTFHCITGAVPPFVIVAVNVTLVPGVIAPDGDEEMLIVGVTEDVTEIVVVFDAGAEHVPLKRVTE